MTDHVLITWTDDSGAYTNEFMIENPTLAEVKTAYVDQRGIGVMPMGATAPLTAEAFYAALSERLVNQVLAFAQQHKQQKVIQAIPPIAIVPVEQAPR
jgi:hypothetical protein